ncbi:PAS domain S-box-containing protein/diguanylate cyclase (GGDEF) domain-containing protein [Noviherbaspirillum humi]|uniref:PAS domain S-box-containing protein/diguanylate cyclase (GGDEF) domain-containing protein n=1 Tax=Noviherbaspirillum humi TaxID=1688639 RepID=A0A239F303_9BURK|nr:EAL domain-containing protein [Noviherbaspirillum humi]SNS51286.1 PAS domain S-box-containing protein/diguanylate cyclase (GGDEF) domain-containing protein [Noviherbaspirillum humi]
MNARTPPAGPMPAEWAGISGSRELIDRARDGIMLFDADGRIEVANPALERMTGHPAGELAGRMVSSLFEAPADGADGPSPESRAIAQSCRAMLRCFGGDLLEVTLEPIRLRADDGRELGGCYVFAHGRADTAVRDFAVMVSGRLADSRRQSEAAQDSPEESGDAELRRLQTFKLEQAAILERIAIDAPLPEILEAVIRMLESYAPRYLCSILLLDDSETQLRLAAAPSLPPAYTAVLNGLRIGPYAGSCGASAYMGRHVVAPDIANDPLWHDLHELREPALAHGLRACWSMPIFSAAGTILGTFAIYARSPSEPEASELALQHSCCHIASVAIERKRALQALKENEARFREQASLLDNTRDAIFTRTLDGIILFWNKGAERMFGWTREEAVGASARDLLHEDDDPVSFANNAQRIVALGECIFERDMRDKFGGRFTVEYRMMLIRNEDGSPKLVLATLSDITERKKAEAAVHQLAFYDQLTQLPNRRLLYERLLHASAVNGRVGRSGALLLIDLDNFKTINDTLGHDKGDALLQQAAARLSRCMRGSDTVARFGGDEFVVVLEELAGGAPAAAARAEMLARRLCEALAEPFDLNGYEHLCSGSIGITLFNGTEKTADMLLKEADLAMYRAKAEGRNCIRFFDPKMQKALNRRLELEADLRFAAARNELLLHYQPQVDHEGRVTGAEALLRWQHPKKGTISPEIFIPLAEETGLMVPIGQWVLGSACSALAAWRADPRLQALTLAVNVSIYEFRRHDFVEHLLHLLARSGADPRRLKIEITETVLAKNMEDTVEKMSALKRHGVSFSLDDFGTGYSSLSYLKQLPLDQVKIDRSFVRDVLADQNDASITRTVIALGNTLGLEVIAEGVETLEQQAFLWGHGCYAYQGYLYSRPVPEPAFRELAGKRFPRPLAEPDGEN